MCYFILVSSSIPVNVADWQFDNMSLEEISQEKEIYKKLLKLPNVYYIASAKKCSCEFRIAMDRKLGFSEPQEWYLESEESILGTKIIYKLLKKIIENGEKAELLSIWWDHFDSNLKEETIELKKISEEQFRMFEDTIFYFG